MTVIHEEASSRRVRVREGTLDLTLHCHDAGEGEVVIMLHGGGAGAGGWSNFHRNVGPFVDAGFRVLLPDLPGFHESDPIVTEDSRGALNARAIAGLIGTLGVERAHVIGNSLGGWTALELALARPELVDKLVLMAPAGLGASLFTPLPTEGIRALLDVYLRPSPESLDRMLEIFVHDPSALTPALRRGRFESMMRHPEHLANLAESLRRNPAHVRADLSPRLGEIRSETLVVWGRDDRFIPLEHGLKLLGGLEHARLHVFGRCGHWAQWEHADAFNRLVIDFLAA